jgi:hypothetical protein
VQNKSIREHSFKSTLKTNQLRAMRQAGGLACRGLPALAIGKG